MADDGRMQDAVDAVRRFNRFYTQFVGALDARFLGSDLSLAEARLLFEIAQADTPVAADLQSALGLDAGYVSRVLRRFETKGWLIRVRGADDGRCRPIDLTSTGRAIFETIDRRQREKVLAALEPLGSTGRSDLIAALDTIRVLLRAEASVPMGSQLARMAIRTFRTGDMGEIAARQSRLYNETYGWGRELEVAVGDTAAAFLRDFKPGREQCWVAELDGQMAGSILLTDEGQGLARLRLFYVEAFARRRGVGEALVKTCLGFARDTGYDTVTLWTHTILDSARRLYTSHGFRLIETKMHHAFGTAVQGETWHLDLKGETAAVSIEQEG
jgi:DNA-binding MarR family transcriptional regulator/GNAT superfamily N-acetyltransferase